MLCGDLGVAGLLTETLLCSSSTARAWNTQPPLPCPAMLRYLIFTVYYILYIIYAVYCSHNIRTQLTPGQLASTRPRRSTHDSSICAPGALNFNLLTIHARCTPTPADDAEAPHAPRMYRLSVSARQVRSHATHANKRIYIQDQTTSHSSSRPSAAPGNQRKATAPGWQVVLHSARNNINTAVIGGSMKPCVVTPPFTICTVNRMRTAKAGAHSVMILAATQITKHSTQPHEHARTVDVTWHRPLAPCSPVLCRTPSAPPAPECMRVFRRTSCGVGGRSMSARVCTATRAWESASRARGASHRSPASSCRQPCTAIAVLCPTLPRDWVAVHTAIRARVTQTNELACCRTSVELACYRTSVGSGGDRGLGRDVLLCGFVCTDTITIVWKSCLAASAVWVCVLRRCVRCGMWVSGLLGCGLVGVGAWSGVRCGLLC